MPKGKLTEKEFECFSGWECPHSTQIPDPLLDEVMRHLTEAELKVLLVMMRKTFGWKKDSDHISLSQLCEFSGLSKGTVSTAVKSLERMNMIRVIRTRTKHGDSAINEYVLRFSDNPSTETELPQSEIPTTVVSNENPQDQSLQDQSLQENDNESPSLALRISEAYGKDQHDRKALFASLGKFSATVLAKVHSEVGKRVAAGGVENPGAYANHLGKVFAAAEQETEAIRSKEQWELFERILSTAVFEGGKLSPGELRQQLLCYWPAEKELVDKAVDLVADRGEE